MVKAEVLGSILAAAFSRSGSVVTTFPKLEHSRLARQCLLEGLRFAFILRVSSCIWPMRVDKWSFFG